MTRYDLVLFDLLTGLLDSWSLWNVVAGSEEDGLRWRHAYLDITYRAGAYRPYEELVAEAAVAVGLDRSLALLPEGGGGQVLADQGEQDGIRNEGLGAPPPWLRVDLTAEVDGGPGGSTDAADAPHPIAPPR